MIGIQVSYEMQTKPTYRSSVPAHSPHTWWSLSLISMGKVHLLSPFYFIIHPFTFNLCVSLLLKWAFYRQHKVDFFLSNLTMSALHFFNFVFNVLLIWLGFKLPSYYIYFFYLFQLFFVPFFLFFCLSDWEFFVILFYLLSNNSFLCILLIIWGL